MTAHCKCTSVDSPRVCLSGA